MGTRYFERKLNSIPFVQGARKTLDGGIPRNYGVYRLYLRLTADITIITAAATAYSEAFWKLIKRIEVVRNGKDTLKSIDGSGLARMNHFLYGNLPFYSPVPTATGANQLFSALFFLDFALPHSINPRDTILNASDAETLELAVTFGAPADMYSANAANVTINSAQISIHSLEDMSGKKGNLESKYSMIEQEVTATTPMFTVRIPASNDYRAFVIYADVDGNPSDSVIKSLALKNGQEVFRVWDWKELQEVVKTTHDFESIPAGYVFLDFCPEGELVSALGTRSADGKAFSDLTFIMDVTKQGTTTKVKVYPIELTALPVK